MSIIDKLKWRYATKKFDTNKKLSAEQLDELLEAVQLAPSSYGLQHYKVLVIENAEVRTKLREAAYGQPQITDASQLIVFAAETNIDEGYVKNFVDLIADTRNVPRESLVGLEGMLVGAINGRTPEQRLLWAQKQAYIALGVLVAAAADLGIDAGPMEGFDPAKFDEILGLKEKGLTATVIAAVGFRADDDHFSKLIKVRRPKKELFIHI
ncbi:NAD(P)H-dependent oxidoreductase [Mucilaginibacter sp. ZT4R22]|uniref:NAD(P)H-dependent oxidoreductase n=1 Tax=Mucilaginibacter pankratovii TaxID=2772110 RepID=A0ABR7WQ67_9SPHI|nr:NAD(P)H-dependent oxidoreductase [Mucilaginibacter pankratovii]MBD1363407.1 NAD(P)H-dependent oxidoreductase [Mucilaginibacter pankratovii]